MLSKCGPLHFAHSRPGQASSHFIRKADKHIFAMNNSNDIGSFDVRQLDNDQKSTLNSGLQVVGMMIPLGHRIL
jgi:hypothetical protein